MNKGYLIGFFMCSAFSFVAQAGIDRTDMAESAIRHERKKGIKRTIQYRPEGNDFVCVNGKNRYTRAYMGVSQILGLKQATDLYLQHISRMIANISVFVCNLVIKALLLIL